jgi:hypothetical protein
LAKYGLERTVKTQLLQSSPFNSIDAPTHVTLEVLGWQCTKQGGVTPWSGLPAMQQEFIG